MARILVLLFALFIALPNGIAMAADDGTLNGIMTNKTTGTPVAGQKVTLHVIEAHGEKAKQEGETDSAGRFAFTGLSTASELAYAVSTSYQDVVYFGNPVKFEANRTTINLDMPVYDATADASAFKVKRGHLLVFPQQGGMVIGEFSEIENPTDKTVVASPQAKADGKKGTLLFTLPAGAKNTTYGEGEPASSYVIGDGWVMDTRPVFPGSNTVIFYYELPYTAPDFQLTKKFDYSVDDLNVLARDVGQGLVSPQLQPGDKIEGQDGKFLRLTGKGFSAGAEITIHMSNIPANIPAPSTGASAPVGSGTATQAGAPKATQGILYQLLVVALGVALLAFAGAYFLRRQRAQPRPALATVAAGPDLSEDGMTSLLSLAALDDAFEKGEISEEDYRTRREDQKKRISEMLQQKGEA